MTETKLIRFGVTYSNEPVNQALTFGEGDSLENDLHLLETPNDLKLTVTRQQYTDLLSAAINGCNRYFPENWIEILYPLIKAGKEWANTMTCEDVADCIETNEAVQDAIIIANNNSNDLYGNLNPDYLTPDGTETEIMNTRFPPSERDLPANDLIDCNYDELWSGIYFMVQKLDETGRDWLEFFVSGADKWQRAANLVSKIPIFGSLASTALEQLSEVAQDVLNLYNAYSTEAAQQDIACALFELVCEECRYPTFEEIINYYKSNSTITSENVAEITLKALADFLFGSALATSQLCYHTVIMVCLWTLYIGSTFVGMRGAKWITIWLDNGEEFANDEWIVLCDGCSEDYGYVETDFEIEAGIFNFPNGRDANGALFTDNGSFKQSLVGYLAPANNEILFLELLIAFTNGGSGNNWAIRSNMNTNGVFPVGDTKYDELTLSDGEAWRCWRPSVGSSFRQFLLLARCSDLGAGSTVYIKAVKVTCLNIDTGMTVVHTYPSACP